MCFSFYSFIEMLCFGEELQRQFGCPSSRCPWQDLIEPWTLIRMKKLTLITVLLTKLQLCSTPISHFPLRSVPGADPGHGTALSSHLQFLTDPVFPCFSWPWHFVRVPWPGFVCCVLRLRLTWALENTCAEVTCHLHFVLPWNTPVFPFPQSFVRSRLSVQHWL